MLERAFHAADLSVCQCMVVWLDVDRHRVEIIGGGKPRPDDEGQVIMKARYGLHALQHAAASAWIRQRVDIKRLQVWIGHENIELTIDTYGHMIEDSDSDAALVMAVQEALLKPSEEADV